MSNYFSPVLPGDFDGLSQGIGRTKKGAGFSLLETRESKYCRHCQHAGNVGNIAFLAGNTFGFAFTLPLAAREAHGLWTS